MKLVCSGDWHLDTVTSGVTRWAEIETAIEQSVQLAIDERADMYVFLGDLCDPDGWCVHRAIAKAIDVSRRLRDAEIVNVWIAGNHDVVEDGLGTTVLTPLAATGFGQVFEKPDSFTAGDTTFIVLPFTPSSHAYNAARAVRVVTGQVVILGHLNMPGIAPGSETKEMPRGREVFWPMEHIRRVLPASTLCIGGHYHKAQEYDGVQFAGSLARLRHDEEESVPSVLVVEV